VSAGNGAVEVFPTRTKMTKMNVRTVHEIGSERQKHRKQFPIDTILNYVPTEGPVSMRAALTPPTWIAQGHAGGCVIGRTTRERVDNGLGNEDPRWEEARRQG
jgi:hypothetical protein